MKEDVDKRLGVSAAIDEVDEPLAGLDKTAFVGGYPASDAQAGAYNPEKDHAEKKHWIDKFNHWVALGVVGFCLLAVTVMSWNNTSLQEKCFQLLGNTLSGAVAYLWAKSGSGN